MVQNGWNYSIDLISKVVVTQMLPIVCPKRLEDLPQNLCLLNEFCVLKCNWCGLQFLWWQWQDVPRNRKQVYNICYKLSDPKPNKDTLHEVMKLCIEDESRANLFVRCVSAAPEVSCILATNNQLNDMVRFCTNSTCFSILGVDQTFNLGDFAVTVTTYRHLMLESRGETHHPVMVGPMFAHQRKEKRTYQARFR